jgi:hypothetical protein
VTTTEDELLAELHLVFEAVTSSLPNTPQRSWDEFVRSGSEDQDSHRLIPFNHKGVAPNDDQVSVLSLRTVGIRSIRMRRRILLAAVAACLVAAAVIVPLSAKHEAPAAAAMLDEAAQGASEHGVLTPGPNQALQDSYKVSVRATENNPVGTQSSVATFQGIVQEWTLSDGTGQEEVTYGAPMFPSAANAQAWVYGHGIPLTGSIPYTTQGPVVSMGPAIGAFDVSGLPADPAELASALGGISTGVSGLDGIRGPDVVFHRVALLLSTPLLGSSAAFESALYHVLAGLPGVESLGAMADHSGRSGQGFTVSGSSITLIVGTSTGSLLEMLETTLPSSTTASGGPAAGTETLQWLDPFGEQVIPASSVPSQTSN